MLSPFDQILTQDSSQMFAPIKEIPKTAYTVKLTYSDLEGGSYREEVVVQANDAREAEDIAQDEFEVEHRFQDYFVTGAEAI